jgi:hypothetical protein
MPDPKAVTHPARATRKHRTVLSSVNCTLDERSARPCREIVRVTFRYRNTPDVPICARLGTALGLILCDSYGRPQRSATPEHEAVTPTRLHGAQPPLPVVAQPGNPRVFVLERDLAS